MDKVRKSSRSGSVLVMVLIILAVLCTLIASMAVQAELELRVTNFARKRRRAEGLAFSGIAIAEMLLAKRGESGAAADEEDDRWKEYAERLDNGLPITGLREELGDGQVVLDIVPEPALININKLHMDDWERLLEVAGVPEENWPELIDSFFDWIDTDSKPREEGGEAEDYYKTLDEPYMPKNGPLDTIGELLLVKGFSQAIVYGGVLNPEEDKDSQISVSGIADMLTTYGDGKVNVNAASMRVLMTLPGVDDIVAGAIIEEREGWLSSGGEDEDFSFQSVNDLMGRISGLNPGVKARVTTSSKFFRINSVGQVGRVTRRIWAVVEHTGREWTTLRWREEP